MLESVTKVHEKRGECGVGSEIIEGSREDRVRREECWE